jgi:tripeptide aminopeptidase
MNDAIRERAAAATEVLRATADQTLQHMLELGGIAGPTHAEGPRADWLSRSLAPFAAKIASDDVGNVIACLCTDGDRRPPIILAAHLDTVFPAADVRTPELRGDVIHAPGIGDNTRGLVAVVALARALHATRLQLRHPIRIVGTVGEEGEGDLRGVKHLCRHGDAGRVAAFIAVDGAGIRRIIHRGLGARRARIHLRGPGGHSWADRGRVNPLHAAARLMTSFLEEAAPHLADGRAAATFARASGGTGINVIPADVRLEVDLRSEDAKVLDRLWHLLQQCVQQASVPAGTDDSKLDARIDLFGDRPVGETAADSPLVRAAVAATVAVGETPELTVSSTDANVPMSLGIPAIALGAGGDSDGMHTTAEWYADRNGTAGLERLLLTLLLADQTLP